MKQTDDDWLNFVGVDEAMRALIADGFTSDGLVVGDSVEKLAQRVGATILMLASTAAERRFDEVQRRCQEPNTYVIALVDVVDADVYVQLMKSGVDGVADIESGVEHIAAVTAAALRHDCLVPSAVLRTIMHRPDTDRLSDTSIQIIECLDQGMNTKQIAAALSVSGRTARRRISNLLLTLGVSDAATAVERARELSLLDPTNGSPGRSAP